MYHELTEKVAKHREVLGEVNSAGSQAVLARLAELERWTIDKGMGSLASRLGGLEEHFHPKGGKALSERLTALENLVSAGSDGRSLAQRLEDLESSPASASRQVLREIKENERAAKRSAEDAENAVTR